MTKALENFTFSTVLTKRSKVNEARSHHIFWRKMVAPHLNFQTKNRKPSNNWTIALKKAYVSI